MTRKQNVQLLVGIAVAAGLLALFLRGQNWSEIGHALRRARPADLAALVVATIVAYVVRAWRWGYLYRPLVRVPFKDLLSATYVGFMSGLLVPRSGEVLRPYLISRRHAVTTSAGFATIIVERLIDLITVLGLFALYLYVLPVPPAQTRGALFDGMKVAGLGAALVAGGVLAVLILFHVYAERAFVVARRILAWFPERLARPFEHLLRSFGEGLAVLQAPAPVLAMIGVQSILIWLAIGYGFHRNNQAFGIELPFHSTFLLLAFLTVGVAIPTPGGVGGFHGAYLVALSEAFGVPQETATAAGLSAHAFANLPVLVLGLVFLTREGLTMGKVAELAGAEPGGVSASKGGDK